MYSCRCNVLFATICEAPSWLQNPAAIFSVFSATEDMRALNRWDPFSIQVQCWKVRQEQNFGECSFAFLSSAHVRRQSKEAALRIPYLAKIRKHKEYENISKLPPSFGTGDDNKTDDFLEKFQGWGGHFQSKKLCCCVFFIIFYFGGQLPLKVKLRAAGLHKLWYPGIRDMSTWSNFGAHGEHRDVFLFSNLGALWFSENLIRYSLHICLREVKNNLFSFKNSY